MREEGVRGKGLRGVEIGVMIETMGQDIVDVQVDFKLMMWLNVALRDEADFVEVGLLFDVDSKEICFDIGHE